MKILRGKTAITILVVSLILLSSCVPKPSNNEKALTWESTLKSVIQKQKVVIGVLPDFSPWSSLGTNGNFEGYDVDIAYELGKALDVEVEIVAIDAPNRVASLVSGKVDAIIACITPTHERAKSVAFSIPYAGEGQMAMVKKDSGIELFKDLDGKNIALVRGGTPDLNATPKFKESNILRFDTIADAYTAFKSGKADALIENDSYVYSEIKKNKGKYCVVEKPFSRGLISVAVKQNDWDWLNYMNNFITNIRYDGTNAALYKKWFGVEPASLNLD